MRAIGIYLTAFTALALVGAPSGGLAGNMSFAAPGPPNAVASDYRLGPGDKVRISVFGVDTLGGEFEVPGTGKIPLPLIGETPAAGMTVFQLQNTIETALKNGYVNNPHVSVQVLNYRPFYILGEINKPGEYAYTDRLTVLNAVAEAGGFTYRARTKIFRRRHIDDATEETVTLNANARVEPGDTIRIQERSF